VSKEQAERRTCRRQSKLFLYLPAAPTLCMRVLILSSGMVESDASAESTSGPAGHSQTVISPAPAPTAKVVAEDSFPDSGFNTCKACCCSAA
jgi:hypothetical protein